MQWNFSWLSPPHAVIPDCCESYRAEGDPFHLTRLYITPVIKSQERAQHFNKFSITAVPVPQHMANLMRSGMDKYVQCFMMYKPLLFNSPAEENLRHTERNIYTVCQCGFKHRQVRFEGWRSKRIWHLRKLFMTFFQIHYAILLVWFGNLFIFWWVWSLRGWLHPHSQHTTNWMDLWGWRCES